MRRNVKSTASACPAFPGIAHGCARPWQSRPTSDVIGPAIMAEALGYDSVWVNHHILNVGYVRERLGDRPYYDALTTLTWVAERTSRVRLGTTVPLLPYLNPLVLAKTVATLDLFSGGRVTLGVGVGTLEEENRALGSDYATRGAYANEAIQVLRELWTADDPAFAGRFFNFAGVRFSPSPLQPGGVPILVGGGSRAALGRCARLGGLGDGWHPIGGSVATVAGRDCGAPRAVGRARPQRRRHASGGALRAGPGRPRVGRSVHADGGVGGAGARSGRGACGDRGIGAGAVDQHRQRWANPPDPGAICGTGAAAGSGSIGAGSTAVTAASGTRELPPGGPCPFWAPGDVVEQPRNHAMGGDRTGMRASPLPISGCWNFIPTNPVVEVRRSGASSRP